METQTHTPDQEVILPDVAPLKKSLEFQLGFMVLMVQCGRIDMANTTIDRMNELIGAIPDDQMVRIE